MHTETLTATVRDGVGKGVARKLRAAGQLPAVIYGQGNAAITVAVPTAEVEAIFRRTANRNTLLSLTVGGDEHVCLVKEAQRHPVGRHLWHLDLYRVDPELPVRVRVELKPKGTAQGVKMGGRLQVMRRHLDVVCKPADIPAVIHVDVTKLEIGKFAKVSAVTPPDGVTILYKGDFNLFAVIGKRGAAAAEEAAEA
jgi:large subunit ribosomal protein L25